MIVKQIPRRRGLTRCLAIVAIALATAVSGRASADELADQVRAQITATLNALQQFGDFVHAQAALQEQFDRVITTAEHNDKQLFRDAALALRMVEQLKESDEATRLELLKYLQDNEAIGSTLAFLIGRKILKDP